MKEVSLQSLKMAVPSIQELMKEKELPSSLKFPLARAVYELDSVLKPLEDILQSIMLKYLDKKTNTVKKNQERAFIMEQNEFLEKEMVPVDLPDIPEKYVEDLGTDHIFLLLPIINFIPEPPEEEPEEKSDKKK